VWSQLIVTPGGTSLCTLAKKNGLKVLPGGSNCNIVDEKGKIITFGRFNTSRQIALLKSEPLRSSTFYAIEFEGLAGDILLGGPIVFIVAMRDPVARIFSNWKYTRSSGRGLDLPFQTYAAMAPDNLEIRFLTGLVLPLRREGLPAATVGRLWHGMSFRTRLAKQAECHFQ